MLPDWQAIEAGDGDILWDAHPKPRGGENRATGHVIVGEVDGVAVRECRFDTLKRLSTAGHLLTHGQVEQGGVLDAGRRQRLTVPGIAHRRAIVAIELGTGEVDRAISACQQVLGHGAPSGDMIHPHVQIQPFPQLHDLNDRLIPALQYLARRIVMAQPRHHQARGRPAQKGTDQLGFPSQIVIRLAQQQLIAVCLEFVLQALDHVDEYHVGQRGHDHRNHATGGRGQAAGNHVAHVADLLDGRFDLDACRFAHAVGAIEVARDGDRGDPGFPGHVIQGRLHGTLAVAAGR